MLKLTESVALPALRLAVPSTVVPSLKVICPVAAVGVTLAVKTVFAPTLLGLTDDVTFVVVAVKAYAGWCIANETIKNKHTNTHVAKLTSFGLLYLILTALSLSLVVGAPIRPEHD